MAKRIKNFLLGISLFVIILIIWQLLTTLKVIPTWILSSPKETFFSFFDLAQSGVLVKLLLNSFSNILPAFLLSLLLSLILGTLVGINTTFRRMFLPFLAAINSVPSLAWLPIIILFLGFTHQTIWVVIFISSFTRIIYNVIGGVRDINNNWLLVAQNLKLNKFETIIKIILPGALPQILSGIRVGFGSAWRSLIGAEMLVIATGGLGKYIWMSQWAFKFDQVISGVIVIALVGVLAEQFIFRKIEKITLLKWGLIRE